MNYSEATTEQLYTIVYHDPCSPVEKRLAWQELDRRGKCEQKDIMQQRITRNRNL